MNEISLRDYFAGQALIGLLNSVGQFQSGMPEGTEFSDAMAGDAYWIANAMLEARKRNER